MSASQAATASVEYDASQDPFDSTPYKDGEEPEQSAEAQAAMKDAATPKKGTKPTKKPRKNRAAYSAAGTVAAAAPAKASRQVNYPLKKPGQVNFFSICPDADSRMEETFVIENMSDFTLVNPLLVQSSREVALRVKRVMLVTCVTHKGQYFVWPIALGSSTYLTSVMKVVERAERGGAGSYVRITWDSFAGAYEIEDPNPEEHPDLYAKVPVFEPSGSDILDEALSDSSVDDLEDPRIKKLL